MFVPSEDFLSDKMDYISQKFGFVTTVFDIVEILMSGFGVSNEMEPPVVVANFGNSSSKYNYGGEVVVLDLSWYAPYKSTVDVYLRAVLWVFFLWRLFVALPNIINGVAGTSDSMQYYDVSGSGLKLSAKGKKRRGG